MSGDKKRFDAIDLSYQTVLAYKFDVTEAMGGPDFSQQGGIRLQRPDWTPLLPNAQIFLDSGPITDLDTENHRGAMAGILDSVFYSARTAGGALEAAEAGGN